jgi:hypothetical protein
MPKPKRLTYPTSLIDQNTIRQQRDLQRLHRKVRRRQISKQQALTEGETIIQNTYKKILNDIQTFLNKHGLRLDGDPAELQQGLNDTLTHWRLIVERM